jgi:hypothetical protein
MMYQPLISFKFIVEAGNLLTCFVIVHPEAAATFCHGSCCPFVLVSFLICGKFFEILQMYSGSQCEALGYNNYIMFPECGIM